MLGKKYILKESTSGKRYLQQEHSIVLVEEIDIVGLGGVKNTFRIFVSPGQEEARRLLSL